MTFWLALLAGCGGKSTPNLGSCELGALPPPQIRLLTRAEYNATVADLLPDALGGAVCTTDPDCDITSQSCIGGTCQADPCGLVTFQYPGNAGAQSVHIAGSFNGWPATLADGGWAMTWVPEVNAWVAKQSVVDGEHTYKLVIDEAEWITDPSNPNTVDDGFGGQNSVLAQSCDGTVGPDADDPTASFPVESRPAGYAFDNHASSGLVTQVHVEQYARAATDLAGRLDRTALVDCGQTDAACIRSWVEGFGKRVFRRPLEPDELDRYTALVTEADDLDAGVEIALRVFLQSPWFLYRFEVGEEGADGIRTLTGWERATALSYLFWGTTPDATLLDAASSGELETPEGIETQARRLLESPRARAHLGRFALQWLGVSSPGLLSKQPDRFPEWNASLGESMAAGTQRTFEHVLFDGDQRFDTLMTSDVTYADAALADLYDVGTPPAGFGPVEMPNGRRGLIGQASVLATYAHSDQTSPILRGLFVRQRLLCEPELIPPADVPSLPEVDPNATTRDRLAQHSSDPFCNSCHRKIDPIGFAFERFDAIGAWRDTENGIPIDTSGTIEEMEGRGTDDVPIAGLADLALALAASETAQRCFVTQVWRYAGGRLEAESDTCALDDATDWFVQSEGNLQEALIAVTQSPGFTHRSTP